jgi:hypothetical protein
MQENLFWLTPISVGARGVSPARQGMKPNILGAARAFGADTCARPDALISTQLQSRRGIAVEQVPRRICRGFAVREPGEIMEMEMRR